MAKVSIDWFEIPVLEEARAASFYSQALQCELSEMEGPGGPMKIFQNDGMPVGALIAGEHNAPAQTGALIYFNSDDIDAALGRIEAAGGKTLVPKTSIGPYGFIAQFLDSEGNRMALHSA